VRMSAQGLCLVSELAEDVRQRALQTAQCTEALARVEKDLNRVMAAGTGTGSGQAKQVVNKDSSSSSSPPPLDAVPSMSLDANDAQEDPIELADVGRWFIEQRTLQNKLVALRAEVPKKTMLIKPGPSFECRLNEWTFVAGCTWVLVIS
jgi:hypothetical protein